MTRQEIVSLVDRLEGTISEVGHHLWVLSEPSLREVKSSACLQDVLRRSGFTITREGQDGVPTAFVAEYGQGKPVLGIMLEYDALPGLGNEAVPRKTPRQDGTTTGHGCGHNLIGAGALGAALATRDLMEKRGIAGTLRVYGAAAEETEGAKVYMARAGVYHDVDAMLHWHPDANAMVANVRSSAMSQMYVEFRGKTAHAGQAPWEGRSALHALEVFLHSANMMREHVEPTARIHYIIKQGGQAPNIVPDLASVMIWFRDADRKRVNAGVEWIKQMAKGAALATQTQTLAVDYFGLYDLLPNTPLAQRMQHHFESVGLPTYTAEETAFAKSIQKGAGLPETGMTQAILPLPNETRMGGSTDVGDVSWITPTMGLVVPTIPEGVGVHTWMATACHGMSLGSKAAVAAAKILTLTGVDFLTDPNFHAKVRADFEKRTRGFVYTSPIAAMIKEPIGLPVDMRRHGSIADLKEAFYRGAGDETFGAGSA